MSVKISDLEIEPRQWPLLVKSYNGETVHISHSNGRMNNEHYLVTDCNKAFAHAEHLSGIPEHYRLCAQCGDRAQFEAIVSEMQRLMAEERARYIATRDAEIAAYDAEVERFRVGFAALADSLKGNGYTVERRDFSIIVQFSGLKFEIKAS